MTFWCVPVLSKHFLHVSLCVWLGWCDPTPSVGSPIGILPCLLSSVVPSHLPTNTHEPRLAGFRTSASSDAPSISLS